MPKARSVQSHMHPVYAAPEPSLTAQEIWNMNDRPPWHPSCAHVPLQEQPVNESANRRLPDPAEGMLRYGSWPATHMRYKQTWCNRYASDAAVEGPVERPHRAVILGGWPKATPCLSTACSKPGTCSWRQAHGLLCKDAHMYRSSMQRLDSLRAMCAALRTQLVCVCSWAAAGHVANTTCKCAQNVKPATVPPHRSSIARTALWSWVWHVLLERTHPPCMASMHQSTGCRPC